jgi:hypothetical protein
LFTGAWVEDNSPPLYTNENCPIVTQTQNCPGNGRPDSNYLNWRWQPQGCDLPAFDAKAFLELMRGKTLAFVGDSVARNQYESLLCMLWQVNFLVTSFFHSNLLHHLPIMSGMLRYSSSSHHKLGLQGLSSIYAFIFVEIRRTWSLLHYTVFSDHGLILLHFAAFSDHGLILLCIAAFGDHGLILVHLLP